MSAGKRGHMTGVYNKIKKRKRLPNEKKLRRNKWVWTVLRVTVC